jgi:hypothetical protein
MKSTARKKRRQRPAAKPAGRRKAGTASRPKSKLKSGIRSKAGRKPPPGASGEGDPLDAYITGAAHALDLTIERSWMPAVRANLKVTLTLGAVVDEFPLPDETEPAPVFKA